MPRRVPFPAWFIGLSLVLSATSPLAAGQRGAPPGPPARVTNQGPGVIVLGRVIDGDSERPVAGAMVQLGSTPPSAAAIAAGLAPAGPPEPSAPNVIADGEGRFVFRDVQPGDYPMTARLAGYLSASYGQRRPQGPSDRLSVVAGRPVTEATIRMWRYASINGVVVDDAGEPAVGVAVRGLRVTMAGGRRRLAPTGTATTDDRGVYRLPNLVPGEYFVVVPVTTTSSATSTVDWYTRERLAGGSTTELLESFRESRAPTPSAGGLRVGDHTVSLSGSGQRGSTAPYVTPDGRLEVYRTVYHPSATTINRASSVTISSAEERTGVDLQLVLAPAVEVSGEVIGPDGPAAHIGVRLLPADTEQFTTEINYETAETSTDADGRFTLLGVPPGQYTVEVLRVPRPRLDAISRMTTVISTGTGTIMSSTSGGAPPLPAPATGPTLWAERSLAIGDADVAGVSLVLQEGARISGRFEFEGRAEPPAPDVITRVTVRLTPASGQRLSSLATVDRANPDGTFRTVGYPPGRYFLVLSTLSSQGTRWRMKSAMYGGRDVIDQPLELEGDDVSGVVITFTDTGSDLNGSVPLANADDDALVVIFPADFRTWIDDGMPSSRTRTARTGRQGQFTMTDLRPGAYLAIAVAAGTALDLQDPAVVNALARLGTPVEVPESGSSSVRLPLSAIR